MTEADFPLVQTPQEICVLFLHSSLKYWQILSSEQWSMVRDIFRGSPDEEGCPREVELIAHGRGKPEVVNISDCVIVGQGGWFGSLTIQLLDRIC